MFFLFGIRSRDRLIGTPVLVCEVCGTRAAQALSRRSTKFTAFFIPLFPIRPSRYHLECGHCGVLREVDRDAVSRLAV